MPLNDAVINIRNLRLRTFIGFNPEEKEKKQDVIVNIEINYAISNAVLQDNVDNALDYKQITKQVIEHVENGRFLLLEKLVADVLEICSRNPLVSYARVTIDKPHALRFADSVSLALEYVTNKKNNLRLVENTR
jgi:D-erythro-7,8-dihydroneopterin triphosphate epimerase